MNRMTASAKIPFQAQSELCRSGVRWICVVWPKAQHMDCAELKSRAVFDFVWVYRALVCMLATAFVNTCVAKLLKRFQKAEISTVVCLPCLEAPLRYFQRFVFQKKSRDLTTARRTLISNSSNQTCTMQRHSASFSRKELHTIYAKSNVK